MLHLSKCHVESKGGGGVGVRIGAWGVGGWR